MQHTRFLRTALVFAAASIVGAGCSKSSTAPASGAPTIQAIVLSLTGGNNPIGWLQQVTVRDNTGTKITNATVTVNGTALTYNATNKDYRGSVAIATGAAVQLGVTVGGTTYAASGTQYSTFPSVTAPTSGATWQRASANPVTWTAGAPTAGASYVLGLYDNAGNTAYPAGGNGIPLELPTTSTTHTIPASSITTAGSDQLFVGIGDVGIASTTPGTGRPIPNAATGSGLWLGGITAWVPVTVQ